MSSRRNKNWWLRYWERKSRLTATFASALAMVPYSSVDTRKSHDHPRVPEAP